MNALGRSAGYYSLTLRHSESCAIIISLIENFLKQTLRVKNCCKKGIDFWLMHMTSPAAQLKFTSHWSSFSPQCNMLPFLASAFLATMEMSYSIQETFICRMQLSHMPPGYFLLGFLHNIFVKKLTDCGTG